MRTVDVNPAAPPAESDADELWVFDPRSPMSDPSEFDEVSAVAGRSVLVGMPGGLKELEHRLGRYRAAGAPAVLRLFPGRSGHNYPLEPWAISPLPELADREELTLLIDMGRPGDAFPWAEMVRFARDYPRLPMMALGAPLAGPLAPRALDTAPNLLIDTSGLAPENLQAFAPLVATHGAFRFAYGSAGRGVGLAQIAAVLGEDDARAIAGGTADEIARAEWGVKHL